MQEQVSSGACSGTKQVPDCSEGGSIVVVADGGVGRCELVVKKTDRRDAELDREAVEFAIDDMGYRDYRTVGTNCYRAVQQVHTVAD